MTRAGRAARLAVAAVLLLLFQGPLAVAEDAAAPPEKVIGYAFAKASPIPVFDDPQLVKSQEREFAFGTAYEVFERTQEYAKIRLPDGATGFVRLAHVSTMPSPAWLTTSSAFHEQERGRIRLWESPARLNDFLSGNLTRDSQWDYEEYFTAPPDFQLKLPIVGTDTLELLGGDRQVNLVGVLMPITKHMYEAFETAKTGGDLPVDLHFLVDASGSTKGFLERAMRDFAKASMGVESLKKRKGKVVVASFGASRTNKASLSSDLRPSGVDQSTETDSEPLVDGLRLLAEQAPARPDARTVLVVLSGADVDLSADDGPGKKAIPIEDVDLKLRDGAAAIFAQITPEPGTTLRTASERLAGIASVHYLDFSEKVGEDVAAELVKVMDGAKGAVDPKAFAAVAEAARQEHMMAFLPRELTAESRLPKAQAYAAQADWYTVRLWLAFDTTLFEGTGQ